MTRRKPSLPAARYRCTACDAEPFRAWETAQRHANEAHHGARVELQIPERAVEADPRRRP